MPIPFAAAVPFIDPIAQGLNNIGNRRFQRKMYERQYGDQIKFWNMQNEYNSPQAQMKRFQEAGLNPHLIYGQGSSGLAGSMSVPNPGPGTSDAPEFGKAAEKSLANINATYDLNTKKAGLDNLRAQNTVIHNEGLLKEAQAEQARWAAKQTEFNYLQESRLAEVSAEARMQNLRKIRLENDTLLNRDAREAAMNASSLQEAIFRMLNMQQQREVSQATLSEIEQRIRNMKLDGRMKQLDVELREKYGLNPNDPLWARYASRVIEELFEPVKDLRKQSIEQDIQRDKYPILKPKY